MICPKCGGKIKVSDLVHNDTHNETYRRKECKLCGYRFYTTEYEVEKTSEFWRIWSNNHRNSKE